MRRLVLLALGLLGLTPAQSVPALPVPPLRAVGSVPPWVPDLPFRALAPADSFHELYAGRADLVLGSLPPPAPPAGLRPALNVPVGVYAVAVAYRLPGVQLHLDVPTLCRLLAGQLPTWDHPALAQLNPGVQLPALPVLVSARVARNGVSYAVASACVAARIWPYAQLKSNWSSGAAFTRAALGAQRTDLNIPGSVAVFTLHDVPPGAQVALLRAVGGQDLPPRSVLGLSGPPPTSPAQVLPLPDVPGSYPLRGLVWASVMREQRYRSRTLAQAQALRALLDRLRGTDGPSVAGLPPALWTRVPLQYGGEPLPPP
ncbi:hypothetical protein [Deinococcus sonorensis]|uniref:PBP domain-containing protein n=2 Tax=Deinococcus sonorensis TaxID=309891 RepID=A0AAU7UDW0_9DEIO